GQDVGRFEGIEAGADGCAGEDERIGGAAGAVGAVVGDGGEVEGEVAGCLGDAVAGGRQRALVEHDGGGGGVGHHRVGAVVLDGEHAGAEIDGGAVAVAVGVGDGLDEAQQFGLVEGQRGGVVVAAGVGVPDVVELGE